MVSTTNPILSICLPVYNQSQLVKDCLANIVEYKGNDVEIIVNDDNSTEDISKIVDSFNDCRIKYFKNKTNIGHDKNILMCFKKCSSDYAFLLRVRDRIVPDSLPYVISSLNKFENVVFLTGNAVDENGHLRLKYRNIKTGNSLANLKIHSKISLHPSGAVYSLKYLNLIKEEEFMEKEFDSKFIFLYHHMIRTELADKGNFVFLTNKPIWQYTDTRHSKDIAVNSSNDKSSVLGSELSRKRFSIEFKWTKATTNGKDSMFLYKWLIKRYLFLVTWWYKRNNGDQQMRKHYNYEKKKVDVISERRLFKELVFSEIEKIGVSVKEKKSLFASLKINMVKNLTIDALKYYIASLLRKSFVYSLYKKIMVHRGKA